MSHQTISPRRRCIAAMLVAAVAIPAAHAQSHPREPEGGYVVTDQVARVSTERVLAGQGATYAFTVKLDPPHVHPRLPQVASVIYDIKANIGLEAGASTVTGRAELLDARGRVLSAGSETEVVGPGGGSDMFVRVQGPQNKLQDIAQMRITYENAGASAMTVSQVTVDRNSYSQSTAIIDF